MEREEAVIWKKKVLGKVKEESMISARKFKREMNSRGYCGGMQLGILRTCGRLYTKYTEYLWVG